MTTRAQKTAEAQAAQDAALMESLVKRDGVLTPPQRPSNPTIGDNFIGSAALIAQAKKDTHLTENTLIKLFELQMSWALQNRQTTQQSIYEDAVSGGGEKPVGDEGLPEPDETITAATEE